MRTHRPLGGAGGRDALGGLTTDGPIFLSDGRPWRLKGVTAFGELDRYAHGQDIDAAIVATDRANTRRVWPYVAWPQTGWDPPPHPVIVDYLRYTATRDKQIYLTLLTDDDPRRLAWALDLLAYLTAVRPRPTNLILEGANEPRTNNKRIDTAALRAALEASGFLYTSGDYEDSDRWFGKIYDCHTARDGEWPRRSHDLYEFFTGAGPDKPTHPHRVPCIAGEPAKPQDVGGDPKDYRAYFGGVALLGAGGVFHFENGKYAHHKVIDGGTLVEADGRPDARELALFHVAMDALDAFPADAPRGPYNRPIDTTLRTYVVGSHMVRIRPTTPEGVVPGTPLDADGILWRL